MRNQAPRRFLGLSKNHILSRIYSRPGGRFGLRVLLGLFGMALGADFLAADKPLLARLDGQLFVLPNLTDPVELRPHSNQSLYKSMRPSDWLIPPLVAWGASEQDKGSPSLSPPCARHWLGTDNARRDVLSRLIHGSRIAILVGTTSVIIYIFIGSTLGLLAAYFGGWVDAVILRLIETVSSIPVFFLILATMGMLENTGIFSLLLIIGLVYWTRVARLVRAEALRVCQLEFVKAAEALGFSTSRIIIFHVLPNTLTPILVAATFGIAGTILIEASLSFLGFGTPDSVASWGGLLRTAMNNFHAWWLVIFPGAAIFLTVLALNLTGEALRDGLDPRFNQDQGRQEVV